MTLYCDVDGTLLDSSARHETLLRDLLRKDGLPCLVLHRGFRSRRYWQQHGVESFGSLPQVFAAMTDQTKEE